MKATCYCQHAVLQRTYSSYQQNEDRHGRMVTLNERRLLYIWSDTDLSSILSLLYKQTRERETYVLNH